MKTVQSSGIVKIPATPGQGIIGLRWLDVNFAPIGEMYVPAHLSIPEYNFTGLPNNSDSLQYMVSILTLADEKPVQRCANCHGRIYE